jgi:peptidoglycan hydrolase-like protein with peptidoglycan-binding domain
VVDGAYGPQLRTAISNYEQLSKLPVTGLATTSLVRHLDTVTGTIPRRQIKTTVAPEPNGRATMTSQNRNEPSRSQN